MVVMTDGDKVPSVSVRWRPSELAWGLAHADVQGLGPVLENRIAAPTDDEDSEDDLRPGRCQNASQGSSVLASSFFRTEHTSSP
jgi:hypothetical protein